jgi:hypothetical protein
VGRQAGREEEEMTWSIEPGEPVTFEVALRCGTPQALTVHWENGMLFARTMGGPQHTLQPTLEDWKRLWRAVDKAGIWNWGRPEDSEQPVLWRIALDNSEKRVTASGFSVATSEFRLFIRALKKLLPGIDIPLPS